MAARQSEEAYPMASRGVKPDGFLWRQAGHPASVWRSLVVHCKGAGSVSTFWRQN